MTTERNIVNLDYDHTYEMPDEMNEELYVDAAEAAELLDVSVGTLYAYVSRKGLRSFPVPGSKKRRYWRPDVEALRAPFPAADPLSTQALVKSTSLTLLTENGLFYRGQNAILLSEHATLEDVAALLWQVPKNIFEGARLPILTGDWPEHHAATNAISKSDLALSMLPVLEQSYPRSADLSPEGYARTSAKLLRWFADFVSDHQGEDDNLPVHVVLSRRLGSKDQHSDLIRRALVLAADHELDPTTYAVRAAANTGITPFSAALVGIVAGRGQRLRHSRAFTTARFVRDLLNSDDSASEIVRLVRAGEPLPGFASVDRVRAPDPRASALLQAMRDQLAGDAEFKKLDKAIAAALDLRPCSPEFILPIAFLGLKLGYKDEPLLFSTVGRLVGWLAHAQEQYSQGEFVRPRAAYAGILPDGSA